MVSCNEAIEILNNLNLKPVGFEKVFITDSLNRILAEDIIAKDNSPEYKTSSMDGYAIKFEDQNLNEIEVKDRQPAGSYKDFNIENGEAIKIYTGSIIPNGANCVIPIENVTFDSNRIKINSKVPLNFAIRKVGENYKEGEVLIKKGTKLDFAEIGVLASLNIAEVLLYKQPTISILSTGNEILEISQERENLSQIRSSNNYTLFTICKKYGFNPINLGVIKDNRDDIEKRIKLALENSDVVVTTGGVSVGDYDFIRDIVENLNGKLLFKKVNIKPGQHIKILKIGNKLLFALPGFAISSTVTFLLFAVPFIKRMEGVDFKFKVVNAILNETIVKKHSKFEFKLCNLKYENGNYHIDFKNKKIGSSAILTNMLGRNTAIVKLDEETREKKVGDIVQVIKFYE